MTYAIEVEGVGKRFHSYHTDRPATLQEALLQGLRRMEPAEVFWALREVNFKIEPGTMVGLIGQNGAGKSTLLRLIGGVGRPDEGRVEVRGRVGALLDLGAGFHPDLTGRENVFVSGVIAGLTRQEVMARFESIVAFAELELFIDNPLRTYSTGMQMRLAFAVATHIEPEILLIDEVLAVGDLAFQQKCLERIARFKTEGCTILLVSHDTSAVQQLCDTALWLRGGQLVARDSADIVVNQYIAEMSLETRRRTPTTQPARTSAHQAELRINENRLGSLEMEITGVRLLDPTGEPVTELEGGSPLQVEIKYLAPTPIVAPIFGATITTTEGLTCYDTSTAAAGLTLPTLQGRGQVTLNLGRLDLNGGQYYMEVGVYEQNWAYAYDYHWHIYSFSILQQGSEKGLLRPPSNWSIVSGQ